MVSLQKQFEEKLKDKKKYKKIYRIIEEGYENKIVKKQIWKNLFLFFNKKKNEDALVILNDIRQKLTRTYEEYKKYVSSEKSTKEDGVKTVINMLEKDIKTDSDFIVCKNCKSTDIDWMERQTRSADESATIFLHCRNCHSKWKK